jgi:hypothetical protein
VDVHRVAPLWSSSQSFWLHIETSRFDSWRYQNFGEVVGLERGPLSLVSKTEELFGRKRSGSGLENRDYGRGDALSWSRDTLYQQNLTLTLTTSGSRLVCSVCSRTKATEFSLIFRNVLIRVLKLHWRRLFPSGKSTLEAPLKYENYIHSLPTRCNFMYSYAFT